MYYDINLLDRILQDLKHEDNSENAVRCLNMMITNALAHAPDCLDYMSAIRDKSNLRFCAIPQVCMSTPSKMFSGLQIMKFVKVH